MTSPSSSYSSGSDLADRERRGRVSHWPWRLRAGRAARRRRPTGSRQTNARQTYAVATAIDGDPLGHQRDGARGRIGGDGRDLVRAEPAARLGEECGRRRVPGLPDDRDLDDRREREVHRAQPLGEAGRIAGDERHDRADRPLGGVAVAALARPGGQPQQDPRRHRVPGRDRVVLDVLGSGHQPLVVVGGIEEAAGRIREVREHAIHQGPGDLEPFARRTSPHRVQGGHQPDGCSPRARRCRRRARPSTTGRASRRARGGRRRSCRLPVPRRPDSPRRAPGPSPPGPRPHRRRPRSRARSRPPAPCRRGPAGPLAAAGQQAAPGPRPAASATSDAASPNATARSASSHDPRQDRHALPVALLGHAVRRREEVGRVAQHLADLGGTPGEREALDAVGVGVLAGGERAVLGRQLAPHVVERPGRDREQVAGRRSSAQACR